MVAFLDRRPVFKGHTLVIPRAHVETLADLPADKVGGFFLVVQRLVNAVEEATGAQGTFVAINNRVSQSVPHLHYATSSPHQGATASASSSGPARATGTTTRWPPWPPPSCRADEPGPGPAPT